MSRYDPQAEFACAYVRAVAATAGYFIQETNRTLDADGLDLIMVNRGKLGTTRSPMLGLQVKSEGGEIQEDPFPYDLEIKNYDELRDTTWQFPRILVVVIVPRGVQEWLEQSEAELVLRRCGYWLSLRDEPTVTNKSTRRVHIPRGNVFDVKSVQQMMQRVADGGSP